MLALKHYSQIVRVIILLVAVNMMHNFFGQKLTAKFFFGDHSMLVTPAALHITICGAFAALRVTSGGSGLASNLAIKIGTFRPMPDA